MSAVDRSKLNALIPNLDIGKIADPELRQAVFEQIYTLLELRALETDVLLKTNATVFTPSANYHPSTKKYTDDEINALEATVLTKTNTTVFTPTAEYHPSTKKYTNDEINAAIATVLTKTNTTPYTPTTDYHPTTLRYVVDAINEAIVNVGGTAIIQTGTVFPTTPTAGQSFFKADEDRLYVYSGTAWEGSAKTQQENWISPTLLNGWVNFSASSWETAGFFKDEFGIVHLKGSVNSGTIPGIIFVLPLGYRPPRTSRFFGVTSPNAVGAIYIYNDGSVSANSGNNGYFALDGISFKT